MFQKPSASTSQISVVNLDTLGTDKAVKKDSLFFIPLFSIVPDGVGINIDTIRENIIPWFKYQFRQKDSENPGKVKTVNISWVDSMLRANEKDATLNDPGVTLGLHLPGTQRKHIMGFGVPGLGFPDKKSRAEVIRVPVLWRVTPLNDTEGNIDPKSGKLALLELKASQLEAIVKEMEKATKPSISYETDKTPKEKYTYQGIGYAYRLDKDTSLALHTYKWSKTDMTASEEHWRKHLEAATKAFNDSYANAMKVGYFYSDIVNDCQNGEISFAEAERMVVASIAKRLLTAWGEPYGDTVEDILTVFYEVAPNFSYEQGAGISKAVSGLTKLDLSGDESEGTDPF